MKAIVCQRYGPPEVLQCREVPKPDPRDHEVLIRIRATTVTSADCRVRGLDMPRGFELLARLALGFSGPRQPILGTEFAGDVEAVGARVRRFKPGDAVFALGGAGMGGYAEYRCMPEGGCLAIRPGNLAVDEAAALSFGGTTALDFLRRAQLRQGEKILINGASGGVGTAAVQLARHFGADVTAVCSSANADLVRSLGARRVIDYTREDFTRDGQTYDLIMDVVGTAPFARCKGSLKEKARLLLVLATLPQMLAIAWQRLRGPQRIIAGPAIEQAEDLQFLAELAQAGEFKPVIDRRYPFEQMVQAHRYVGTGRKRGNVVVQL
jgi:NADPH:quinone reductase-like Zn-dependent oxidoreductase